MLTWFDGREGAAASHSQHDRSIVCLESIRKPKVPWFSSFVLDYYAMSRPTSTLNTGLNALSLITLEESLPLQLVPHTYL